MISTLSPPWMLSSPPGTCTSSPRWMAAKPQPRAGVILSIDVSDEQVARVVFDFDGAYTDFLTLMKIDGRWKIIDKVFIRTQ